MLSRRSKVSKSSLKTTSRFSSNLLKPLQLQLCQSHMLRFLLKLLNTAKLFRSKFLPLPIHQNLSKKDQMKVPPQIRITSTRKLLLKKKMLLMTIQVASSPRRTSHLAVRLARSANSSSISITRLTRLMLLIKLTRKRLKDKMMKMRHRKSKMDMDPHLCKSKAKLTK